MSPSLSCVWICKSCKWKATFVNHTKTFLAYLFAIWWKWWSRILSRYERCQDQMWKTSTNWNWLGLWMMQTYSQIFLKNIYSQTYSQIFLKNKHSQKISHSDTHLQNVSAMCTSHASYILKGKISIGLKITRFACEGIACSYSAWLGDCSKNIKIPELRINCHHGSLNLLQVGQSPGTGESVAIAVAL